ncbi:ATPase, T2SS/T4P/T4SS family [Vibrio vulnificus]|uniref:ATPase, T2SS/T4P/T4SS family n=1 Tax=Vibrio vulnificus TaxID=672 RepID=UPI003241D8A3
MTNSTLSDLIKTFGSQQFLSSGNAGEHDVWFMTPSPIVVNNITNSALDTILQKALEVGYRDIYLASNDYIRGRLYKRRQIITDRVLTHNEIITLVEKITDQNYSRVYEGKSDNGKYTLIDKTNANNRIGFRYCLTKFTDAGKVGFEIALRPIPEMPPTAEQVGIEQNLLNHVDSMSQGMILLIGGTGTGKTTTLAAIMRYILQRPSHIRIIEFGRPPEYTWHKIAVHPSNQIIPLSVAEGKSGGDMASYSEAIATAVRKAPDWIAVTEMTDQESFRAAIEFANTGHIVSSSMHAKSIESAYSRIFMKFPEGERDALIDNLISETEILIAQELVDKIGGGLIAVREQLIQTQEVKEILKDSVGLGISAFKRRCCLNNLNLFQVLRSDPL